MRPNPQETANLAVTFTEEILNGKLQVVSSDLKIFLQKLLYPVQNILVTCQLMEVSGAE